MYPFPDLEPVCCSMSSFNCCFLTCIQTSQEAGQVVWYSCLFNNKEINKGLSFYSQALKKAGYVEWHSMTKCNQNPVYNLEHQVAVKILVAMINHCMCMHMPMKNETRAMRQKWALGWLTGKTNVNLSWRWLAQFRIQGIISRIWRDYGKIKIWLQKERK